MASEREGGGAGRGRVGHEDEWLHYGHPRMPLSERAKIFLPFDPLRGFRAELARRERLAVERQAAERGEAEEPC